MFSFCDRHFSATVNISFCNVLNNYIVKQLPSSPFLLRFLNDESITWFLPDNIRFGSREQSVTFIFVQLYPRLEGSFWNVSHVNELLTNLSEGENDMRSSHASPSRPRLLQLLLFPLLLEREEAGNAPLKH